jgi:hypothetical protein
VECAFAAGSDSNPRRTETLFSPQERSSLRCFGDGLNYYKTCSDSDWKRTLKVEDRAVKVANLIAQYGASADRICAAGGV